MFGVGDVAYRVVDLDVDDPAAVPAQEPAAGGLAAVIRRDGRPIGFAARAGVPLGPRELRALVAEGAAEQILAARIEQELIAAGSPAPPERWPSLTVAVCTRERPELLERWLAAVLALRSAAAPREFDVLVVDNAPEGDATATLVASSEGVDYAREPRPGLDFARNRALAKARSEFVAFVDDDAVVDRHWLGGLAAALGANPDAALVTGQVLPYELATAAQVLFEAEGGFRRGFRRERYRGEEHPENPFYPCGPGIFGAGCNMVVHRQAALDLGGFDEALDTGPPLPGGGDLDIFYRVIRAGLPLVYEPRMLVFHEHRRDMAGLLRQYRTWGQGYMAFVAKSYGTDPAMRSRLRGVTAWWFGHYLAELGRRVLGRSPRPAGPVAAQLAGGVAGIAGTYGRSRRRVERIRRRHR